MLKEDGIRSSTCQDPRPPRLQRRDDSNDSAMRSAFLFFSLLLSSLTLSPAFPLRRRASGVTTDPTLASDQTFDYIVIGGGLSGLTVAARLAEDPSVTVLVVEAGNDDREDPRVFDIYNYGQAFGTELSWNWQTVDGKTIEG